MPLEFLIHQDPYAVLFAALTLVVVGPALMLMLRVVFSSQTGLGRKEGGRTVLTHGTGTRLVSAFFLLTPVFWSWAALAAPDQRRVFFIAFGAFSLLVAGPMAAATFWHNLVLEDDALVSNALFSAGRRMAWSEIVSVRFNESMLWYVIESSSGGRIRVSGYMSGLQALSDALLERAPESDSVRKGARHMGARWRPYLPDA